LSDAIFFSSLLWFNRNTIHITCRRIKEQNRKVKSKNEETVLLLCLAAILCLTSTLQPVWTGNPIKSIKTPASINVAIRDNEVRNPTTTERRQYTGVKWWQIIITHTSNNNLWYNWSDKISSKRQKTR